MNWSGDVGDVDERQQTRHVIDTKGLEGSLELVTLARVGGVVRGNDVVTDVDCHVDLGALDGI